MIEGLSIVVPAYNEEATIAATVTDAFAAGAGVARALEVVVCDDGSRDRTRAILDELAATEPRLRVVARRRNRGIEASIRTLYAVAAISTSALIGHWRSALLRKIHSWRATA